MGACGGLTTREDAATLCALVRTDDAVSATDPGGPSVTESKQVHQRWMLFIDSGFGLLRTIVRGASWVAAAYFLFRAAEVLAGQHTQVDATLKGVLDITASRYVGYVLAILLGGAYARERKLRRQVVQEHSGYIKALELRVDPKRSSSKLTPNGMPRPEDRDGA